MVNGIGQSGASMHLTGKVDRSVCTFVNFYRIYHLGCVESEV